MAGFKTEKALLLHVRSLGERTYLLSLFTPEKGRFSGALKSKTAPDIASFVDARWQARLEEQTGTFYVDNIRPFSVDFLDDKMRLAVLSTVCELLHQLLPERQPSEFLYDETMRLLNCLNEPNFLANYLHWEIALLGAIGFGLDFSACAGGGNADDLAYVSPKTGRAVSREKGLPYQGKLLVLPRFLWCPTEKATRDDILKAFILTTHFFTTHAGLRFLPTARERLTHYILTEKI